MLYLFPTELEAKIFRELSPDAKVVVSGVGMVATAATIAHLVLSGEVAADDTVVLAGIAGAYGDSVPMGEVVEVVEECCAELPQRFQQRYINAPYTTLRGVASNTVHSCSVEQCGAEIENMEGAALFALAEEYGFRAVEIRAVSNRVGDSFEKWHIADAVDALAQRLVSINLR